MGIGAPWYPHVDPSDLRRAAQAYGDLGGAIATAAGSGDRAMKQLFTANSSDTIAPYRQAWDALNPSNVCGGGYLGQLAAGCHTMAAGLEEAAAAIEELRNKIDEMVAAGAVITIGVGIITFGLGSAVAGTATAGTVATTTVVVISQFLTRVAIVAAFEFVGGYVTSLSLQAIRQTIFEPGRPIELDHGEALGFGGLSAVTGGSLVAVPGLYRVYRSTTIGIPAGNGALLSPARSRGMLAEIAVRERFVALGETPITQRRISVLGGTGSGSSSTADVIINRPGPLARALFPEGGGNWRVGIVEVKAGYPGQATSEVLSPGQRAVLEPLGTHGGGLSRPLAVELGVPSRVLQPGEASPLTVIRISNEEFTKMPLTLRVALERFGPEGVLQGEAGIRNTVRFRHWMHSLQMAAEVP